MRKLKQTTNEIPLGGGLACLIFSDPERWSVDGDPIGERSLLLTHVWQRLEGPYWGRPWEKPTCLLGRKDCDACHSNTLKHGECSPASLCLLTTQQGPWRQSSAVSIIELCSPSASKETTSSFIPRQSSISVNLFYFNPGWKTDGGARSGRIFTGKWEKEICVNFLALSDNTFL